MIKIKKHSGEEVFFDKVKLKKSLINAGADENIANDIIEEINREVYEGVSSKKIYNWAFQKLKVYSSIHAAKYSLKNSLLSLGPAGFYFEKFIARLFVVQGFEAKNNLFVEGNCISHELDVIIKKEDELGMIECKFHGSQEVKTDVKVPMYILSRFNDVNKKTYFFFENDEKIKYCWIATNSKFTADAIKFAKCSGIRLLSWDYPIGNGIKNWVTKYKVYPVTCLTTLSKVEKELLLKEEIVTVYDLVKSIAVLGKIFVSESRQKKVKNECEALLR